MRKISMKRKSRTPNSESSETKEDERSGDESSVAAQDQESSETSNGSPNKKSKKNKRASKSTNEENGTDKKSKKNKESAEESADEEYEVEEIIDDKMVKGTRHFLVRWKGYEEESDTWEPETTLNCAELIEKYLSAKETDAPAKGNKKGKQSDKSGKKKKKEADADKDEDDEDDDAGGVYEVDKIIEVHHKKNGKREFLVHWKGYKQTENTWEPEENMNCPDLIEKFMSKVERAKKAEVRQLRVNRQPTSRFTLMMVDHGRKLSRRNLGKQRVQYFDKE